MQESVANDVRKHEFTNIDFQKSRGQDLLLFLDEFLEFLGFLLGVGWPLCAVEVVFEARCEGHESSLRLRSAKRYACQLEGERRRMKGERKKRKLEILC